MGYKTLDLFLKFFIMVLFVILIHEIDIADDIKDEIPAIKKELLEINKNQNNINYKIDSLNIKDVTIINSIDSLSRKTRQINNTIERIRKSSVIIF